MCRTTKVATTFAFLLTSLALAGVADAAPIDEHWTVLEGFQRATYAVTAPSPGPSSPAAFAAAGGLTVRFAPAMSRTPVVRTLVDAVPPSESEDRIHVVVDVTPCLSEGNCLALPTNAFGTKWSIWINADLHVYATVSTKGSTIGSAAPTVTPGDAKAWAGSVAIPWRYLGSAGQSVRVTVGYARFEPRASAVVEPIAQAEVTFESAVPRRSVPPIAPQDDHRVISAAKTYEHELVEQKGGPSPAPTVPPWPALSVDAGYPTSEHGLVGLTFAQSGAALLSTLQQKIAASAALTGASKSLSKSLACGPCASFETRFSPLASFAQSSTTFTTYSDGVGADAEPFSLSDVSDLGFGGIASIWTPTMSASLSQAYSRAAGQPGIDDNAIALSAQPGAVTLSFLAASRSHAASAAGTPPPAPLATPVSHVSSYSGAVSWQRTTASYADPDDSHPQRFESSTVTPLVRESYDATDAASDGFTGVEFVRNSVDKGDDPASRGWQETTVSAIPGYRFSGLDYREIDGDALPYPYASGPTLNLGVVDDSNGGFVRSGTLASYWLRTSASDFVSSNDATLSYGFKPNRADATYSLGYEIDQSTISTPLLAATQVTGFSYPALRDFVSPSASASPGPPISAPIFDETISVGASTPAYWPLSGQGKVGYDFRRFAPHCIADPLVPTRIICGELAVSRFVTYSGLVAYNGWLSAGGSFKPSEASSGRSFAPAEKVFNAFLQAKLGPQATFLGSTSNDRGTIVVDPTKLQEVANLQINLGVGSAGVLALGYSNQNAFAFGTAVPVGNSFAEPAFPQRVVSEFVDFRIGTPALLTTQGY